MIEMDEAERASREQLIQKMWTDDPVRQAMLRIEELLKEAQLPPSPLCDNNHLWLATGTWTLIDLEVNQISAKIKFHHVWYSQQREPSRTTTPVRLEHSSPRYFGPQFTCPVVLESYPIHLGYRHDDNTFSSVKAEHVPEIKRRLIEEINKLPWVVEL